MVIFEHCNGDLRKAVFGGSISELCADICLQINLIYGAMKAKDVDAAEDFRKTLVFSLVDSKGSAAIFSSDCYDAISKSESFSTGAFSVGIDAEELIRQLKELQEEEAQNEDE